MTPRTVLLTSVLALGLLVAVADSAQAGPAPRVFPSSGAVLHGGVSVGIGARVPLHGPRRYRGPRGYRGQRGYRGYGSPACGHWVVQPQRVWAPGPLVGYDRHGHEVYGQGYWTVRHTRVWVPAPCRVPMRARPRGRVSVGVGFYR